MDLPALQLGFGPRILKRTTGASLVELMVVVSIIGVLTVAGRTSYKRHMLKVYQADAIRNLRNLQTLQEEYYSRNGSYVAFPAYGKNNCTQPPGAATLGFKIDCKKAKYSYSCQFIALPATNVCVAYAEHDWVYPGCTPLGGATASTDEWEVDFTAGGGIRIRGDSYSTKYQCL